MKFSDAYKREMDEQVPSAARVEELLAAVSAVEAARAAAARAEADSAGAGANAAEENASTGAQATREPQAQAERKPQAQMPERPFKQHKQHKWRWTLGRKIAFGTAGSFAVAVLALVVWVNWPLPQLPHTPPPTTTDAQLTVANANYRNVFAVFEQAQADEKVENAYYAAEERREALNFSLSSLGTGGLKNIAPAPDYAGSASTAAPTTAEPPVASTDFSDTNIQVEGVQEGDIVKTDGRYIYALNSDTLTIIAANNGHPKVVSRITLDTAEKSAEDRDTTSPFELLDGEQSAADVDGIDSEDTSAAQQSNPYAELYVSKNRLIALNLNESTTVDIFDTSKISAPVLLDSYTVTGNLVSSRMIDNILYLATEYSVPLTGAKKDEPATFVPFVLNKGEKCLAKPDDIRIAPEARTTNYTHVVGIDTAGETALMSQTSLLGGSDDLYASTGNLYLMSYGEMTEKHLIGDATTLTRVKLDQGRVSIESSRRLPGHVKDQFSLDEKEGVLRVVTTRENWDSDNGVWEEDDSEYISTRVYTLDQNLEVIGSLKGIGKDEEFHSCRYLGDYVYFVTFMQTDPLFAVNLSNPTKPKLVGELHVPGFSEYLHPWSDTLLFGLGNDADEETGVSGALKLSMFDTSDPTNISEKDTLILDDYEWSEATADHHAILVNRAKNLIAFPADETTYLVYSYTEGGGFKKVAEIEAQVTGPLRGLFIADVFYVLALQGEAIGSYRLPNFTPIDSTKL